jgi:hypothetical protein
MKNKLHEILKAKKRNLRADFDVLRMTVPQSIRSHEIFLPWLELFPFYHE